MIGMAAPGRFGVGPGEACELVRSHLRRAGAVPGPLHGEVADGMPAWARYRHEGGGEERAAADRIWLRQQRDALHGRTVRRIPAEGNWKPAAQRERTRSVPAVGTYTLGHE